MFASQVTDFDIELCILPAKLVISLTERRLHLKVDFITLIINIRFTILMIDKQDQKILVNVLKVGFLFRPIAFRKISFTSTDTSVRSLFNRSFLRSDTIELIPWGRKWCYWLSFSLLTVRTFLQVRFKETHQNSFELKFRFADLCSGSRRNKGNLIPYI